MSTFSNILKDPLNIFRLFFRQPLKNIPPTEPSVNPKGKEDKAEEKKVEKPKELDIKEIQYNLDLVKQKIESSDSLVKILLVALFLAFLALGYAYFQFASNYFNDYAQKFEELNDDRYLELRERVTKLEDVIESISSSQPQTKSSGQ